MEDDKMVLIAYHMLESSTGAYLEWLVNELKMTANKTEYKDAHLVMFLVNAINPHAR
jgi:ferric iron reductase protein FhuF